MLHNGYNTSKVMVKITESRLATMAGKSSGAIMSEMQSPRIMENAMHPIAAFARQAMAGKNWVLDETVRAQTLV